MRASGVIKGGLFVVASALLPLLGPPHWVLNMLVFVLMFAALSSAWNLVGGLAGYPSLGHAAFFGLGAYAFALLLHRQAGLTDGWHPFAWLPAIGVGVALLGVPVAALAMRTRADVFAIVTITLVFVVQTLAFNLHGLTGGAQGLSFPVAPFAADTFERPFYYVLLALLVLAMLLTYGAQRSKVGLALATVRGDEDKARGVGVPVAGVKVLAFAVSVGLTAMVGAVWAYYQVGMIYPQFAVDPLTTIAVVLMTFLGGRGTLWGPVLGAVVLEGGQQYLAYQLGASQFYLIAYAMVFLLIMLALPRGVLPTLAERRWLR
ncbi:branched-chain amino acid ABC transporter permease [Actinoplanes sp. NPDC051411]|uniref:branched-chain amino acid ABC transporter permease n=1 Tax=Actinoplanes sp. NPDC051411 TaxID=3155522 RepID=UPI00343E7189